MTQRFRFVIAMSLILILIGTIPIVMGDDESTVKETDRELERDDLQERETSSRERIDKDKNGELSFREFYGKFSGKYDNNTLKRMFDTADVNDDGKLNQRELKKAYSIMKDLSGDDEDKECCREKVKARLLRAKAARKQKREEDKSMDLREFHSKINGRLNDTTVKRIFNAADVNDDGELDQREQKHAFSLLMKLAKGRIKERIKDKTGCSSEREGKDRTKARKEISVTLRELYGKFNGRVNLSTVKRIFNAADMNGDGELDQRELKKAFTIVKNLVVEKVEERV